MDRITRTLLIGMFSLLVYLPSFGQNAASNEVIFRFAPGTSEREQDAFLAQYNLEILEGPTPKSKFILAKVTSFPTLPEPYSYNSKDSINILLSSANNGSNINGAGVNSIVGNLTLFDGEFISNTPIYAAPSIVYSCPRNPYSISIPYDANLVRTGIFDTGIDKSLINIFPQNLDRRQPGYNFIGLDITQNIFDDHGHGNHMAFTILRELPHSNYPSTKLKIYKTHNANGVSNIFDLIQAVDQAIQDKIQIVNMSSSFTAPYSERNNRYSPLRLAMQESKMLFITAAGNNNNNNDDRNKPSAFPASYELSNIISVAAINCSDQLANFSNYGSVSVDIAASGKDIAGPFLNNDWVYFSGTSPATALVSRVAAGLASYQTKFNALEIKEAILCSATKVKELSNKVLSGGYLNAEGALLALTNGCSPSLPSLNWESRLAIPQNGATIKNLITPTNIELSIEIEREEIGYINITNLLGQTFVNESIPFQTGQSTYTWDFPTSTSPTIYFLTLHIGDTKETIKIFH